MCCSDITNASIITEPSLWTDIANASAITTLILFVFYVIGRIWVIIKSSKLVYEEFDVKFTEKSDHCAIDEYNNFYVIDKTNEILIIKSSEPIMNLKIVPIKFNKSFKDITPKKSKAIFEYDRLLNSNEPLALQIIIPEGIPHHKVIIKRFDYLTVSFNIGYNGRVGGMSPDDYRIRHTVKSILYYLVK